MRKLTSQELSRLTPEENKKADKTPIYVILDNVRSLNNIGSVFRSCDAFAVKELILCGITARPPHKDIHRTALGATDTVAWSYCESTSDAVQRLKAAGVKVYAVEQVEGSVFLDEFFPQRGGKYALVFGNEVFGVDQQVVNICDGAIEIPQAGTKHSLNVSVCAGAVLWDFFSKIRRVF